MTPPERVGTGRRDGDGGHCDAHEQNTTDLASLKANSRLLAILLPIIMAISASITGYYVSQTNSAIDKMADSMAMMNDTIHRTDITMATNSQKLENIEFRLEQKR